MLFKNYKEIIESIYTGLKTGSSTATVQDYFQVLGITFLLVAILVAAALFIFAVFKMPGFITRLVTKSTREELLKFETQKDLSQIDNDKYLALYKKEQTLKKVCIFATILIYIPFVIPTALILIDLLIRLL